MKNLYGPGRPLNQRAVFSLFLGGILSCIILWLIVSGMKVPIFLSLVGLVFVAVYFGINFEKTYIPLILVIALPLGLFITAIPNLKASEVVIPGLFFMLVVRTMVSRSSGGEGRVIPLCVIVFFLLGFASYLRHPSLPTQVFARTVDLGNFRRYWTFFMGFMSYLLAYYLFRRDRERKELFLVKLLLWVYVGGILLHLTMSYLRIEALSGFLLVDWGPAPEGDPSGGIVFRGWTFGWYGLHLFLILTAFPGFPKKKLIKGLLFLLALLCVILSGARAVLLAVSCSAILVCVLRKKFFRLVFPLAAVTAILVVSYSFPQVINTLPPASRRIFTIFPSSRIYGHREATTSALARLAWWREAFTIISRNPYRGIGFEKVGRRAIYLDYSEYAVRIGASHSAYIATGVMLGLPGMAVLLWLFILHLRRSILLTTRSPEGPSRNFKLWLACVLFSYNIIFFFAGSPQNLFPYLFYAGLVNLNWLEQPETAGERSLIGPPVGEGDE